MPTLTKKQKSFAEHYAKTGNATDSYKAAGYAGNGGLANKASAVLSKPHVQEYVQEIKHGVPAMQYIQEGLMAAMSTDLAGVSDIAPARNQGRINLIVDNPIAFMCVRRISWSVGGVKWLADGKDTGEFAELLNKPQWGAESSVDRYGLWNLTSASLAATGNSFLLKSERKTGRKEMGPVAITFLRPDRVSIVQEPRTNEISHYEWTSHNNKTVELDPDDVCHIRHPWITADYEGISAVTPLYNTLRTWKGYTLLRRKLLENSGGVPAALVFEGAKQGLTNQQRLEFQDLLDQFKLDGERFGKLLMLDAGVTGGSIKKIDLAGDISKLDPDANIQYNENLIANMYGVPRLLLGIGGDATYANQSEARRYFWLDTVIPGYIDPIAACLSHWLGVEVTPDLDDIPALSDYRLSVVQQLGAANWLTINEKREWMGYDKVKGGDDVLQPASLIPIYEPEQDVPDDGQPFEPEGGADDAQPDGAASATGATGATGAPPASGPDVGPPANDDGNVYTNDITAAEQSR